jgi:Uma2 family endonuclease
VTDPPRVAVQYSLPRSLPEWELPEVPVPESPEHDELADRLRSVLVAWLARTGLPGAVRRNLAIRWDRQNPRVGADPDVCWLDSIPPGFFEGELDSLRLWLPGHRVPPLAIEIVSRHHPYKDYRQVEAKYAVLGVQELWVYDPRKFGPRALGGPVLLQVWERDQAGVLVREHFSDGPARSALLSAWLVPQPGGHLLISDDAAGARPWPALHEQERARAEQERARAEQERARAEQERARADQLEAELERLRRR